MGKIKLLDCTLRDGGYVNDWEFGHDNMVNTFERLVSAGLDIIEVGFLDERRPFDINRSIMPNMDAVNKIYGNLDKGNALVVAMIDYGTCGIENLGPCEDSFLDGIRVIFKKKVMYEAIAFCKEVKKLGYKVFAQAVSITSYSDRELLDLIDIVNDMNPYTFSMVDTYGLLHKGDLMHIFSIVDHNLDPDIFIGYHAHNNFQLGYANSIELMAVPKERTMVVDGTVYGMGKSAGNCCIELLAMYMNTNYDGNYDINQILEILDVTIMNIYKQRFWGYNLFFYLAASNDCHPNYVEYLTDKRTLSIKSINEILSSLEGDKMLNYDKDYIERLYIEYQTRDFNDDEALKSLTKIFENKKILLIGPGTSIIKEKEKIIDFIKENEPVVIANNFIPKEFRTDYIFLSNSKRYVQLANRLLEVDAKDKIIATSNVTPTSGKFKYTLEYSSLLDDEGIIVDNSLLMLLKLLQKIGVKGAALAGFDGYATDDTPNYFNNAMEYNFDSEKANEINDYVAGSMQKMKDNINIDFITKSYYER